MRFSGTVGFAISTETSPGVWQDVVTERPYFGNVTRSARRLEPVSQVPPETNAGVSLENSISIVADADAYEHITDIRYVKWRGGYWQITNVEVSRPRLVLTIGGVWVGNKA
jgi:hypothetical protein